MIGSSGIGDTPYVIDGANKDRYPLMEPFNASFMLNYAQETTPPKISVISPANQTYNRSSVPLVFSANKAIAWAGYSLDGEQNVTLIDNTTITDGTIINDTLANVTSGFHSITVYANNTFGYMGALENITFLVKLPELSKPFPNAPVAAALGTSAVVVVGAGLLVYFKKRKR